MSWQDYSKADLRMQYRTDLTPGVDVHMQRYASRSDEVTRRLHGELDLPYGSAGPRHTLDIFSPEAGEAPILIFIHGGYWYFNSKDPRRFPAEIFNQHGIAWVPINYRLAPSVTLDEIVDDVRKATAWLFRHGRRYGCDPDRIYVSGNSAGGHLAAALISDNWPDTCGLPVDLIKGACAVSGLFDLEPLLHCEPNDQLRMDLDDAKRNSPMLHISDHAVPLIVTCGARESDEFKRQSTVYAECCRQAGYSVSHFEMADHDHFSIIGEFANSESRLFREIRSMILEPTGKQNS